MRIHVRSKQNVRDKVGPLVDNAGNIITQGFLMAEELNNNNNNNILYLDTLSREETLFKGVYIGTIIYKLRTL